MPEDSKAKAGAGAAGAPCGACRTLRRRCVPGCVFAPYFTAEDFAAVHGVFGASNASKMLEAVEDPEQRAVAAATLVEEARARARDPSFGLVSYLRILQEVNDRARDQVDEARAEIAREFGDLAAAQPVDVAAAPPAVRAEARAQVDAALQHAKEQDARLLAVRNANEARWRELHPEEGTGTAAAAAAGKGKGKGVDAAAKRHREPTRSEKAMLVTRPAKQRGSRPPVGFSDERSHQQMAAAAAEREKALLMRQAAPAKQQHGHHHLGAQHVPEVYGQPRHAGDGAAGRAPPGQGSNSVLLEAMMQLAGAGDEHHHQQQQQQQQQHGQKEVDISQEMLRLQELLDMAELARTQQMMKNDVMGQWDGVAMEQDVTTTTMMQQQIPANTWQHQYPAMPQQMEEASTAELAQTTAGTTMSQQQFAWAAQQYHHDPAAAHHASPWHHQMAPEASTSQAAMASEQDMLLLLQQHNVAAAAESLSAGGARHQFDNNLAAQYDGTELTLGYGGHPDMHQQVFALGNDVHPDGETQAMMQELAAIVELADERAMMRKQQGVTSLTTTGTGQWDPDAAWLVEELRQLENESMPEITKRLEIIARQADARRAQKELGIIAHGNGGHPDGSGSAQGTILQAQAQELHANKEMLRKTEMLMRQFAAAGRARLQQELNRKLEMLMRQVAAAGRAREQELIAQQQQQQQNSVAQQYSGTELGISQEHGHQYWQQPIVQQTFQDQQVPTVQQMLQEQQLADAVGFGGHHQPTTASVQQAAAYASGEHAMAFLPPGSAEDAPFFVGQQPQPNGHQMGSSLSPLPPSFGQLHAQVPNQQRTDGGGQGLNSDLAAYLHYESLSRHGMAGNGRHQQG